MLTEREKQKYNRQLILPDYTEVHQQKLKNAKVLVVGAGGLGSVVLTYLSRTGIGTIGIVEFDHVDVTNLHRQVLYNEEEIGLSKIELAIERLNTGNSFTSIKSYKEALDQNNAKNIFCEFDIIVDCTDNFNTRYLINDVASQLSKPVVFASVANYEGQVTILNYKKKVNYRDIFPEKPDNAPIKGVMPTLLPVIGGIQANEVIKMVLNLPDHLSAEQVGFEETLDGKLLIYNILNNSQHIVKIK